MCLFFSIQHRNHADRVRIYTKALWSFIVIRRKTINLDYAVFLKLLVVIKVTVGNRIEAD